MDILLELSQENIELSKYEAISLLGLKRFLMKKNLMLCHVDNVPMKKVCRLAYTKKVFEIIFKCDKKNLPDRLSKYDWKNMYKKNFCLRMHPDETKEKDRKKYDDAKYAGYIWQSLEKSGIKPEVNLENPTTMIETFICGRESYVCRLSCENNGHFGNRKTQYWPEHHPTTMHPRMARALVNILNPDDSGIIDPFCGAGGILIESCLIGIKSYGYDIDKIMLNRAKINLEHHAINKKLYTLKINDATKSKNLKNIVTDLPYGKSSKKSEEINRLYARFIKNISGRAVIVFPDFVNHKKILKENLSKKLKIKKEISHYIHKTLTRKIIVIDH